MYKNLGLTSEEVCEIGKWQNSQAFSNPNLQLGAPSVAAARLHALVHNVSPEGSAEPEWSRTPENQVGDPGGRDHEGEAQIEGEPAQPSQVLRRQAATKRSFSSSSASEPLLKFQFASRHRQPPSTSKQ